MGDIPYKTDDLTEWSGEDSSDFVRSYLETRRERRTKFYFLGQSYLTVYARCMIEKFNSDLLTII
tara:strand:- start:771 stop:965 length:195 start_codon:yes stop_codon:yes gene_type:complete